MITDKSQRNQRKVGLSFSGGGVHSWAEVAAFDSLQQHGIEISAVSGTSMGAFLAAGVAFGLSADEIYQVIMDADHAIGKSKLFNQSNTILNLLSFRQPMGLVLMDKLKQALHPLDPRYSEIMLSDVPKPLAIPAVDLISGQLIVFSNQKEYFQSLGDYTTFYDKDISLLDACLASSAYPIVISPMELESYQLVDGGVLLNSPSSLFSHEKIDYIIALRTAEIEEAGPVDKRFDVAMRAIDIMIQQQVDYLDESVNLDYLMSLDLPDSFQFGDSAQIIQSGKRFVSEHPLDIQDIFYTSSVKRSNVQSNSMTFTKKLQKLWQNHKADNKKD